MSIILGHDKTGKRLQLNFSHKDLANRHFLITGISGQGKTYATLNLLNEIRIGGESAIVFDYVNAFSTSQLDPAFIRANEDRLEYIDLHGEKKVPVNPFRLYSLEKDDEKESDIEAADRLAGLLALVFKLGKQQQHVIYDFFRSFFIAQSCIHKQIKNKVLTELTEDEKSTVKIIVQQIKNKMNPLSILKLYLNDSPEGSLGDVKNRVLSKMATFIDLVSFSDNTFEWGDYIYNHSKITIIELGSYSNEDIRRLILEFLLWDLWDYTTRKGSVHKPFVSVFDECQVLSFKNTSPASRILTQGRKFGYSSWFITQFVRGQFDDGAIGILEQAATKLFFKPSDKDVEYVAKSIDPSNPKLWIQHIINLNKGQCIAKGCFVKQLNPSRSAESPPIILNIPRL